MLDRVLSFLASARVVAGIWLVAAPLCLVAALSGGSPAAARGAAENERRPGRAAPALIDVAWVGDITPGSRYGLPPEQGRSLFAAVREPLRRADLTLGNLEGTLSEGGVSKCGTDGGQCFSFQAPPENVGGLAWAGFDALSLANNHAFDFGADGQAQTIRTLESASITPAGRAGAIDVVRRAGIDVALVGFAPYPWANDPRDLALVGSLVRAAAREADVVLVLAHLGSEGADQTLVPTGTEFLGGEDRGDTRAFAHAAVDAGADAVLASGPHVLRGIERYRDALVAYSLGNFAGFHNFATSGTLALSGILRLRLSADGGVRGGELDSLTLDAAGVPAPDPSGAAARLVTDAGAESFGTGAVAVRDDGTLDW